MKIISYSLFGSRTTEPWLFNFYLRGFVWNVKMNKLIYPDWQTHVEIDADTFSDYDHIFYGLKQHYGISYNVNIQEPLCKSMLWRLKPVFWADSEIVLCRVYVIEIYFREIVVAASHHRYKHSLCIT